MTSHVQRLKRAREKGRRLWEAAYPNEPWDPPLLQGEEEEEKEGEDVNREEVVSGERTIVHNAASGPQPASCITYDIRAAVERQSAFYYQVRRWLHVNYINVKVHFDVPFALCLFLTD